MRVNCLSCQNRPHRHIRCIRFRCRKVIVRNRPRCGELEGRLNASIATLAFLLSAGTCSEFRELGDGRKREWGMGWNALRVAAVAVAGSLAASADPLPPDASYRPLPTVPFDTARAIDQAMKPQVMERQEALLAERYDLSDHPIPGVMMSGGRKSVQGGVRVKLPAGQTWDSLAEMSAEDIRARATAAEGLLAAAPRQAGNRRPGFSRQRNPGGPTTGGAQSSALRR